MRENEEVKTKSSFHSYHFITRHHRPSSVARFPSPFPSSLHTLLPSPPYIISNNTIYGGLLGLPEAALWGRRRRPKNNQQHIFLLNNDMKSTSSSIRAVLKCHLLCCGTAPTSPTTITSSPSPPVPGYVLHFSFVGGGLRPPSTKEKWKI